ncbi:MAG: biotin--[acetyl-CoA-carboxylase] ligase [Clostridia bacterium]|nr:biotin--[acetyl-CoA-carboxylase] ligase [Clostridia bacterium]
MKTIEIRETDSTNEYCKRNDTGEDMTVICCRQTDGRGTKGRSFISPDGGLYLSVMKHYTDYDSSQTFRIMVSSCVAVCKVLQSYGVKPVIRWANDILVSGLKISGTLIENTFTGSVLSRSIVGIGIDINNDIPQELAHTAISLKKATGKTINISQFKASLLDALQKEYTIPEYKSYMPWLGRDVVIKTDTETLKVRSVDIEEDGRLKIIRDGSAVRLSYGEVTLRL